MNKLTLYKHKRNTDVAIRIVNAFITDKEYKLKIEWWNIVHKPFYLGLKETIYIPKEDWKNWREYESFFR